jgi:hypothetical protein
MGEQDINKDKESLENLYVLKAHLLSLNIDPYSKERLIGRIDDELRIFEEAVFMALGRKVFLDRTLENMKYQKDKK